jgi:hypothetical protein
MMRRFLEVIGFKVSVMTLISQVVCPVLSCGVSKTPSRAV